LNTARNDLVELIRFAVERLTTRLDGLTEDEYFWQPVPGCWTVREVDGQWRGDIAADGTHFAPDPQPITTIAWRLWHLGASHSQPWPPTDDDFVTAWFTSGPHAVRDAVASPDEAVAIVRRQWLALADRVAESDDAVLFAPMGAAAGQCGEASLYGLFLHAVDELIHHGAEIGLLRDLYAHRQ
jgi:hypothetical protein